MANDLDAKVFLVTGGTEGIGKAAVMDFAKRGATIALVGRNAEKTERVASEVKSASGNSRIEVNIGDLSKMADVRNVATQFRASHDRLDVLVNNAGAVFLERQLSADGIEMTFALNHIAYFLLTHEVMDLLKKTPGARVVSTSSNGHRGGSLSDLDEVAHRAKSFGGWRAYCDSKLANVHFTRELARRLAPGATANCVHPGYVQTGFGLNNTGVMRALMKFSGGLFARTPEKGAETLIWLATSHEAAGFNGEYFFDRKPGAKSSLAVNDVLAARLWAYSEMLCGLS